MPFPRRLAHLNRRIANPVIGTFAGRVPPLAVVIHQGRASGRLYRTPVLAFAGRDDYVIAVLYGADSDWVRNVLAAGRCTLERAGRRVEVTGVHRLDREAARQELPPALQALPRWAGVSDFLRLVTFGDSADPHTAV